MADTNENKTDKRLRWPKSKRVRISLDKEDLHRAGEAMEATFINPTLARVIPVLLVLVAFYYALGMSTTHVIDDNLAYRPDHRTANGYYSVDMVASLINREVDVYGWKANNPFYVPSAMLDNMPNYQIGMFSMMHGFVRDLSTAEPDDGNLSIAAEKLGYDATRWYYQLSDPSAMPQPPAEDEYEHARNALLAYNMDRANADLVWKPKADDLAGLLDAMAMRLDAVAVSNRTHMREQNGLLPDNAADDLFYQNKGQLYGAYMILQALAHDYDDVLDSRKSLHHVWEVMMDRVARAVALSPMIVMNGRPDAVFPPSHLSAQGFVVLDAQRAVREMAIALRGKPVPVDKPEQPSVTPEPAIETQAGEAGAVDGTADEH